MDEKWIWSCYITDHEVMPAPRIVQNRNALGIPREKIRDKTVLRSLDYLKNKTDLAWLLKSIWRKKTITDEVIVRIEVGITNNRKSDWDNFAKAVCDSMVEATILKDDKAVQRGECTVFRGQSYPFVGVAIYEGGVKPCLADSRTIEISASPNAARVREKTGT